jgi:hypothetical protein
MAYLMVKACKLESCHMKARGSAKFPILSPCKSQSEEKTRLQLRHLAFDIAFSLEWLGSQVTGKFFTVSSSNDGLVVSGDHHHVIGMAFNCRSGGSFFYLQFIKKVVFHGVID